MVRAFLVLQYFPHWLQMKPPSATCLDSMCRTRFVFFITCKQSVHCHWDPPRFTIFDSIRSTNVWYIIHFFITLEYPFKREVKTGGIYLKKYFIGDLSSRKRKQFIPFEDMPLDYVWVSSMCKATLASLPTNLHSLHCHTLPRPPLEAPAESISFMWLLM